MMISQPCTPDLHEIIVVAKLPTTWCQKMTLINDANLHTLFISHHFKRHGLLTADPLYDNKAPENFDPFGIPVCKKTVSTYQKPAGTPGEERCY